MRRRFFQTYKNSGENLTLVSLEDNNEIYMNVSAGGVIGEIEMKVSGDSKWVPNDAVILNKGDFIEYRGTISNLIGGGDRIGTFIISKKFDLYGDCTSILKDRMLFRCSLAHLFENTPVVNIHSTFLPATTLANSCYSMMFYDCTSLTTAPELPATTLATNCYGSMFHGCTKLNYIKMLATDISASGCLYSWVSNVASSGTFVKNSAMTSLPTGTSGIPSGWTVVNDGEESVNLITFTIYDDYGDIPEGNKTYQAEEGMTWSEWVDSEYNIDSWTLELVDGLGEFRIKHHYGDYVYAQGSSIPPTDHINPELYYYYNP